MFTSLNLHRRALLCPHLIQFINNAFKFYCAYQTKVFYCHHSPASSATWSPLCPVCATRTEYHHSLPSFPLSICLSCSHITFGFCSAVTLRIPNPCNHPLGLCTLQKNRDHGRDKFVRDLKRASAFHGMQMNSLSTLTTKKSETEISLYYFFYCSSSFLLLLFCHSIVFAESSCNISNFCKVLWNKYKHHNWFVLWIWPVLDVSPFPTQTNYSFTISLFKRTNYSLKITYYV